MKRRKLNQNKQEDTSFVNEKIDDAVDALNKNEDEISGILTELLQRDLSDEDKDSIRSIFNSYFKSVQVVKRTVER